MQQARRDIDAVYSMGLFDDVKILPQPAEDSTLENPILDLTLQVKERKNGGLSGGVGISAQVISLYCSFCFPFVLLVLSFCPPSVFPLTSLCCLLCFPSAVSLNCTTCVRQHIHGPVLQNATFFCYIFYDAELPSSFQQCLTCAHYLITKVFRGYVAP